MALAAEKGIEETMLGKSSEKYSSSEATSLRSCCIICIGRVEGPRDMPDCAIKPRSPAFNPGFHYYALHRPHARNLVAIAKVEPDGSLSLNPCGFDYGPIPPLENMTSNQADTLWGLSGTVCTETGPKTYKLIGQGDLRDQQFFLDIDFENNKVQRYRIRKGIASDLVPWKQVRKKGGSTSDPPKTEPSS